MNYFDLNKFREWCRHQVNRPDGLGDFCSEFVRLIHFDRATTVELAYEVISQQYKDKDRKRMYDAFENAYREWRANQQAVDQCLSGKQWIVFCTLKERWDDGKWIGFLKKSGPFSSQEKAEAFAISAITNPLIVAVEISIDDPVAK